LAAAAETDARPGTAGPGEAEAARGETELVSPELRAEITRLITAQGEPSRPPTLSEMRGRKEQEALRQQQETFDQKRAQDARWFALRLAMGCAALVAFVVVLLVSTYILVRGQSYPDAVLTAAAVALFADVLAFAYTMWQITLGSGPQELRPVTLLDEDLAPAQEQLPV
jgi:hypothetical protein